MKILTTLNTMCGHLAMWAVRQSPYGCPDNLEIVVRNFRELARPRASDEAGDTTFFEFQSHPELEDLLREVLTQIPEFEAWNEPRSGHGAQFLHTSRYDNPKADDDFIDLDALFRNMVLSVASEETEGHVAWDNAPATTIPAGRPPC